jgi:hypothetical protein
MTIRPRLAALALTALGCLAWPAGAAETDASPLHDPFRRPDRGIAGPAAQDAGGLPQAEALPPKLVLKGLLLAGPDTVVNINDQLLRIGEGIEGYRLVAATGTQAVLVKQGKRLILDTDN